MNEKKQGERKVQNGMRAGVGPFLLACILVAGVALGPRVAAAQDAGSQPSGNSQNNGVAPGAVNSEDGDPAPPADAQPMTQRQQDAEIGALIQAKLNASKTLQAFHLNVAVQDAGVVTLSGGVPNSALVQQAEALARTVQGVQSIHEKIGVGAAAMQAAQAQYQQQQQAAQAQDQQYPQDNQDQSGEQGMPPPQDGSGPGMNGPNGQGMPPNAAQPGASQPGSPMEPMQGPPMHAHPLTIGLETPLRVLMLQTVDSHHSKPGQHFQAVLAQDVLVDGLVALPRGAAVDGVVIDARPPGKLKGHPILALQLASVSYGPMTYALHTQGWFREGPGKGDQTANNAVGGAAVGALTGAAVGGGSGALLGTAIGGLGGVGLSMFSHGPHIFVPAEAVITFRLATPLTVREPTVNEIRNAAANAPSPQPGPYGPGPYGRGWHRHYGYAYPYGAPPPPPPPPSSGPYDDGPPE